MAEERKRASAVVITEVETPRPPTVLASSHRHVAYLTEQRTSVVVRAIDTGEETEIEGHSGKVTAVAIGGMLVASSSPDATLLYDMRGKGSCTVVAEGLGDVPWLAFPRRSSPDEVPRWLLACSGNGVVVTDLKGTAKPTTLGPHKATVLCCDAKGDCSVVSAACEDGSVAVWETTRGTLICEVVVAPGLPLLSIAVGASLQGGSTVPLCVGCEDGRVFLMEFRDNQCRLSQTVQVSKAEKGHAAPVIAVFCAQQPKTSTANAGAVCATSEGVFSVAAATGAVEQLTSFVGQQGKLAGACAFHSTWDNSGKVLCAVGSAFEPSLRLLKITPPWLTDTSDSLGGGGLLSIFSAPLPQGSPMLVQMKQRPAQQPGAAAAKGAKKVGVPLKGKAPDKAVMFHAKVRSSGYGTPPETRKLFVPKLVRNPLCLLLSPCRIITDSIHKQNTPKGKPPAAAQKPPPPPYPVNTSAPSQYDSEAELHSKLHGGAIPMVKFGGRNCKRLLTCSSDNNGRSTPLPFDKYKGVGTLMFAHSAAVTGIDGSFDGNSAMTVSLNQTVKLWMIDDPKRKVGSKLPSVVQVLKGTPALELAKLKSSNAQDSGNDAFTSPITQASFFFRDKFITLAYGSSLLLYSYLVDIESNDAARLQNHSRYLCLAQLQAETKVTCFSCNNSISSSIVICGSSDRAMTVFDVATGAKLRTVQNAHDRPVHRISLISVGDGATLSPESNNLFVTASIDNSVKLWDLRTVSCVRRFEGHMNRTHKIGAALSPCAKFIATGSEDKNCCLYDVAQGSLLAKLHGHSDVVSDVCWSTSSPLLVSASHDGTVRFYRP